MTDADYLILGGGSAGCVLASRLSELPGTRVVLVEAGRDIAPGDMPETISSGYPGRAFLEPENLWAGLLARTGAAARVPYEQARVLGGGSSINAMLANRGSPEDYDAWHDAGARGWAWREVLPFFEKVERDLDYGDYAGHGTEGPIPISRYPKEDWSPFAKAAAEAAGGLGYASVEDQNGPWRDGVFPISTSRDQRGERAGVANRYLTDAVRRRPGLRILTCRRADRVLMDGRRAIGAVLTGPEGRTRIRARETFVCCGALLSPALLMRSGIGPAAELAAKGIEVVCDLAGVGENLMEHPAVGLAGYLAPGARFRPSGQHHIHAALRFSSQGGAYGIGDLHMSFVARAAWHALGERLGVLFTWVNAPASRGRVRLAAPDPACLPDVDFRLLSHPDDLHRLAEGLRLAIALMESAPLRKIVDPAFPVQFSRRVRQLARPSVANAVKARVAAGLLDIHPALRASLIRSLLTHGLDTHTLRANDGVLAEYVRHAATGVWHPSGTCRMGAADDPLAVTNACGAVRGTAGLTVCDASIFPVIPRANTNLPTLMAAEKIAALCN